MTCLTITEPSHATRRLLSIVILGAVTGIGIGAVGAAPHASTIVLTGGLAAIAFAWLSRLITKGKGDWLAPPALLVVATVLYYIVRPAALLLGMAPIGQRTLSHLEIALALACFTVLGFILGYKLPPAAIIARSLPLAPIWQERRLALATGALWLTGATCWGVLMWQSGGIAARLAGYAQGAAAGKGVLVVMSAAALAMALVLGWLRYLRGQANQVAMIGLAATTVPMLALHGQRSALLIPVVMAVAIYHYQHRRLGLSKLVMIGIAVVLLVVALGLPRLHLSERAPLPARLASYGQVAGWFLVRNLTSLDALMLTMKAIPGRMDYQWGRGYLDSLLLTVPRQLYPDKPHRNLFNRVLRPGRTTSMALPPAAEGYMNFGWGGVLLETSLFGLIYAVAYAYYRHHADNEGALLLYAFAVAFFVIIFRGGLMGGHIGLLIVYLALIASVSIFCGGNKLLFRRPL